MLKKTQDEIIEWSHRNFGEVPNSQIPIRVSSFLGMVEEVGEIAHAILKQAQGIRGTSEEHEEELSDGIADLLVYTLDFCGRNNRNSEELLAKIWAKVKQRDWNKNKKDGEVKDSGLELTGYCGPLGCDCYPGCWGDHSENWPRVGISSTADECYKAMVNILPYGTYVRIADHVRVLHLKLIENHNLCNCHLHLKDNQHLGSCKFCR
jgi:NTP pyrophosphatase (non-canonical NTP hydrolase)